jgi:metallo-beta-lactamase family protein
VDPLLNRIKKACLEKKGKLIIPAFSVGRTQEVLFALNQLELEKRLPELSYFVDSPLGKKATGVMKAHTRHFNDRLQAILERDDDPFDFAGLKYVETPEDSRLLSDHQEPCVIISASGTADAGRVKHHIFKHITDQRHTVLFVGYCQNNSVGGQLLRGAKMIELFGEPVEIAAEIDALQTMSAHGDSDDLINYISCHSPESVRQIFLVHGEYTVQEAFAAKLQRKGYGKISIPEMHAIFELGS